MLTLTVIAVVCCLADLALLAYACSRPPVRTAPTPLPRPEPMPDRYPEARHRNTNSERTVRLPKLPDALIGGSR